MARWSWQFRIFKRFCDVTFALGMLPTVGVISLILLILNPFFNPGPLFFRQERMGLGGERFRVWKFRTMLCSPDGVRAHDAPLEHDRVTKLGRLMRRSRIDELPNIFNILAGDMCLVGPRPDAWEHAVEYLYTIPYYSDRFRVRPGITGLAQVRGGYADTNRAIERKARFDRYYVRKSCGRLDLHILLVTALIVFTGHGAK
ncbi:sugar transferase [Ovoidimarina sediminis]|uniref:sugar transferase n=1 Tax=Ovoidimarina sediminis TaxID=3079856 RepID=UPI0029124335|nr:sugar transferase [Rhodophyticola sp. MJ-SS7]MDU8946167.1 sugar transferase [Rhodophyticola sp. MJ-SS7]